jgi:hypothetical protein
MATRDERREGPRASDRGERSPAEEREDRSAVKKPDLQPPGERGGPKGPEPTRYGDWEQKGRVSDF